MLTSAFPLQILAIMPCKALPGPHSVKLVAPAATMLVTSFVQSTLAVNCLMRLALISSGFV